MAHPNARNDATDHSAFIGRIRHFSNDYSPVASQPSALKGLVNCSLWQPIARSCTDLWIHQFGICHLTGISVFTISRRLAVECCRAMIELMNELGFQQRR